MYYIISPVGLNELKKFEIPYIEGTQNLDTATFYVSKEGKKFRKITPLSIKHVSNKKDLVYQIASDISFISLCYNCPLYVYVMKDSTYFKELSLGFASYNNYGKVSELFRLHQQYNSYDFPESKKLRVPMEKTYYKGDLTQIETAVDKAVKSINLKENPINSYNLTLKEGLQSSSL